MSSVDATIKELKDEIAEFKRECSQLQEEQKKYRSLFELSGDALSILDLETGKFLECNDSAIKMHGVESKANFLNLTPDKLSPEFQPCGKRSDELAMGYIQKTFTEGPQIFNWVHSRLDGSTFPCLVSLSAIPLGDRQLVLAIGRDITELMHVQDELKQAKEVAENAYKVKSNFLSNMSHEIRTPMNAILGFVEQLEKLETDTERLKQFKIVRNSGQYLLSIINDVLDVSKIESGKMLLENEPFNIIELLNSCIAIYTSPSKDNNITLHTKIDASVPPCILGDETRLKQVILNLMCNAIKFTKSGGEVTLEAHYNSENQSMVLSVSDSGIGIAKDKLSYIFESFAQEDVSTTRKFGGTGLGLSISFNLVRLMEGTLNVISKQGEGSKFYFDFPTQICQKSLETQSSPQEHDKALVLKGDILIAEDNKTNQMLMSMILDNFNVSYEIVEDGAKAVEKFTTSRYDMILMDVNMPIMNGMEATKIIRELESKNANKIPIIAVTANALSDDRARFLDAGMDNYISKPYSEEDIKEVLIKYLT